MPHFVVLIHGGSQTATPDELAAHDQHAEDLIDSGALVAAVAFGPTDEVVRIDADGPAPGAATATAVDGIGVVEASDLDAAVALARRNPATAQGGWVEVRPVLGSWVRGDGTAGAGPAGTGAAPGVPDA